MGEVARLCEPVRVPGVRGNGSAVPAAPDCQPAQESAPDIAPCALFQAHPRDSAVLWPTRLLLRSHAHSAQPGARSHTRRPGERGTRMSTTATAATPAPAPSAASFRDHLLAARLLALQTLAHIAADPTNPVNARLAATQ